jgi:conjugal transfer pilus assembly protein TraF
MWHEVVVGHVTSRVITGCPVRNVYGAEEGKLPAPNMGCIMRSKVLSVPLTALALAVSFLSGGHSSAQDFGPFNSYPHGYFWYEQPVLPLPPDEQPEPLPAEKATASIPDTSAPPPTVIGSAKWLRETVDMFKEKALDNPSQENVRAYFYAQKLAMNRANEFSDAAQRVVLADANLDENNRRPMAEFVSRTMDLEAAKAQNKVLSTLAKTVGIVYVYRSDCPFCAQEAPVLQSFARLHGFIVKAISADGLPMPGNEFPDWRYDPALLQKLRVNQTPSLYLIRPPDGLVQFADTAISMDMMNQRIVSVSTDAGWLSEAEMASTRPVAPLPNVDLTPEQGELSDPTDLTDSKTFVDYVRRRLQK